MPLCKINGDYLKAKAKAKAKALKEKNHQFIYLLFACLRNVNEYRGPIAHFCFGTSCVYRF